MNESDRIDMTKKYDISVDEYNKLKKEKSMSKQLKETFVNIVNQALSFHDPSTVKDALMEIVDEIEHNLENRRRDDEKDH